ncbi:MAG TPA: hypothetical protein VLH84_02615 [Patescibacteria group bacterium]|nr:hypothetical protein [Patescibacteria group bacterium]
MIKEIFPDGEPLFGPQSFTPTPASRGWSAYAGRLPLPAFDLEAWRAEEERLTAIPDDAFIEDNLVKRELPQTEGLDESAREILVAAAMDAGHQLVDACRYGGDGASHYELIDALYRGWSVSQQSADQSGDAVLNSFESFCAAFAPDLDTHLVGRLINKVGYFNRFVVGQRILEVDYGDTASTPQGFGRYNCAGEWLCLDRSSRHRRYIDKEIVDEVQELNESWPDPSKLVFHESGSAALAGIGAEKAILSGVRAIKRGYVPKTGEFIEHPVFSGGDRRVEDRASGTIWAAFGMSGSYTCIRWFDEYPVAFGISQEDLIEYRRQQGHKIPELFETGEGIMAGPEIPLALARVIYVPKQAILGAKTWVAENCTPGTRAISLEAAQMYGTVTSKMSELLAQDPVIIR